MKIGLAGAGLMGHGLGRNILKAGHGLAVLAHSKRAAVDDLVAHGGVEVDSAAALARASDIVLLCLPGSPQVEALIRAMEGELRPGMIIVDASTSEPASSKRLAEGLAKLGVGFADAPMAGGPEQAMAGETGVLVGATDLVFASIQPLLSCYATRIAHMGAVGSGHSAKLVSNYLVTGMIALIADAFGATRAAQVDAAKLYEVMLAGSGNSGALRKMVGPALEGDFDGYKFAMANAAKDISYFVNMADGLGCKSPLAEVVAAFFAREKAEGDPQRNVSQMLKASLVRG
jgi:3-hydroxyisobutyrate dehydrogenase-like beta-hydroxyacid dehydrogenase